jgi:hypothetical protein
MRRIHIHLHHAEPVKDAPSTTPKRPPSTVIKPAPQSPHRTVRPHQARVKAMQPAGVIKGQKT